MPRTFALMAIALLPGCAGPVKGVYPPAGGEPAVDVFVTDHGWHTGVVLPRARIPRGLLPEHEDFMRCRFVEVGWGDRDYYMAEDPTSGLACKALCCATRSVLHMVGVPGEPSRHFPHSRVLSVRLSARGFRSLCVWIDDQVDRAGAARARSLRPGLYGHSRFYPARPRYWCCRTCNVWTAQALRVAGCPITPCYAVTAGNVGWQVSRFGRVVSNE